MIGKIPTAYHTLCLEPGFTVFHDYELITWVLGPLLYKRHCGGDFLLQTDPAGLSKVQELGLESLYDSIHTVQVPPGIDSKVFWCASRYLTMPKAPCISLDFDAVIFRPFWHGKNADVICMNPEPVHWNPYTDGQNKYAEYLRQGGVDFNDFQWSLPSVNCGVMAIFDEEFRRKYVATVLAAMKIITNCGMKPTRYDDPSKTDKGTYIAEAVLVDQRILAMLAHQESRILKFVAEFDEELDTHTKNPYALHLWKMKHGFLASPSFLADYMDWALSTLWRQFPERWNLLDKLYLPTNVYENVHTGRLRFASNNFQKFPGEKKLN